jgi:eukaryotic-like serine/threonine-protein kinase
MGEVYRARDERLDREVAVKVLPASYSADPDRLRRFEQEAKAAGRLNHPNVLAIHDVGTHDGAPYVVSELLDGGTLRERLAGGALPVRKAVDYALQVARGLGAAHEKGIVHRDLKPENLFVTSDGRVKILDFGLAKLARPESAEPMSAVATETRGTEPGIVLGTVGYMSPEQVRGQATDARSDIFAFGSILYEMLSGRRAFGGHSSADVMSSILKEDPPALADTGRSVPAPLERLVGHCLEKGPEERFQSARDIAYDLEAVSGLSPSVVGAPRGSTARPARRLSLAFALGLAALAAAGGVLAGRITKTGPAAPPDFHQLTYRRGSIGSARFAPDGQSVVYSARWDGAASQLFVKRPDAAESVALALPPAEVLAISASGEMNLALSCVGSHYGACSGTLAQAPLTGGAPREIREKVQDADWAANGSMVLVRDVAEGTQLEFPPGKILYKSVGHLSFGRISPKGDRIAFFDHPGRIDDGGSLVVVDLSGQKTTLAGPFNTAQGIAWAPDGREVWFTASHSLARSLWGVSLSGKLRAIAAVPGNLTVRDISKAGRVLVTHDQERMSAFATGPEEPTERDISWLNWTLVSDLSEDGKTALLEEEGGVGAYLFGLRPMDGSPIVRLGVGGGAALSYDGKWALNEPPSGKPDALVPTGPGEPKPFPHGSVRRLGTASWFPDGRRILFVGVEPGHGPRLCVQEVGETVPRPITPEGFILLAMSKAVSPDGRFALCVRVNDGSTWIYPTGEGAPRRVDAIDPLRERPLRWTEDGRGVYFRQWRILPFQIFRLDLETGQRTPWRRIAPSDLAGTEDSPLVKLSADGKVCAYSMSRKLSTLYVLDGLK